MERYVKESFAVIGKEGSTCDGEGFVRDLWDGVNSDFDEVAYLAKRDSKGALVGLWGAMTDFSRSFMPWENGFTEGLYIAGVECEVAARTPEGWSKWIIPAYEYIRVENADTDTFRHTINRLNENGMSLAGAVHEFYAPFNGKAYLCFPIRRL